MADKKTASKKTAAATAEPTPEQPEPTAPDSPDPAPDQPGQPADQPEQPGQSDQPAEQQAGPAAAPLTPPPAPAVSQPDAPAVYSPGVAPLPSDQHLELVDRDGKTVDAEDLFTDPGSHYTFVTVKERVFERYRIPNTDVDAQRLLYPEGAQVARNTAEAIKARLAGK